MHRHRGVLRAGVVSRWVAHLAAVRTLGTSPARREAWRIGSDICYERPWELLNTLALLAALADDIDRLVRRARVAPRF